MLTCIFSAIVSTIIFVIILLLCEWAVQLISGVAIPPKIRQLVSILIALVLVWQLLSCLGLLGGGLNPPWLVHR
jgi:hypothetical protein